jgi:hypothetical protein
VITMSRTIQVTFDCADPETTQPFLGGRASATSTRAAPGTTRRRPRRVDAWHEFLGRIGVPESEWNSRSAAEDPEGAGPAVVLPARCRRGKIVKNRVHLDVRAAPGLEADERMAALEAECERLVGLGATRLQRYEPEPPLQSGHIVMQTRRARVLPRLRVTARRL